MPIRVRFDQRAQEQANALPQQSAAAVLREITRFAEFYGTSAAPGDGYGFLPVDLWLVMFSFDTASGEFSVLDIGLLGSPALQ